MRVTVLLGDDSEARATVERLRDWLELEAPGSRVVVAGSDDSLRHKLPPAERYACGLAYLEAKRSHGVSLREWVAYHGSEWGGLSVSRLRQYVRMVREESGAV